MDRLEKKAQNVDTITLARVISDWIASSVDENGRVSVNHIKNLLDNLCHRLKNENPSFDKLRFVEECIKGRTTLRYTDLIKN